MQQIAQEDFGVFICRESLKCFVKLGTSVSVIRFRDGKVGTQLGLTGPYEQEDH
jgi:hypothetical protein